MDKVLVEYRQGLEVNAKVVGLDLISNIALSNESFLIERLSYNSMTLPNCLMFGIFL